MSTAKSTLLLSVIASQPPVFAQIEPGTLNPGVLQREYLPPTPNQPQLAPERQLPKLKEQPSKPPAGDSDLRIIIKQVVFTGNTKISDKELQQLAKKIINRQVSFAEIEAFINEVTSFYRERGYFISLAILPKQDVSSGVLQVQIVEGYIEKIEIQRQQQQNNGGANNKSHAESNEPNGPLERWIKSYLRPLIGDQGGPLTISRLERQLLLTEAAGGVEIASVLSSGSKLGATVLTLRISPNKLQASLGADNWVPQQLGDVRGTVSLYDTPVLGIPIGTAAIGSYTWPNTNGLTSLYYSASVPLGTSGLTSSGTFSYTQTNSKLQFNTVNGGESYLGSLAFRYPIQLSRKSSLYATAQLDLLNSSNRALTDIPALLTRQSNQSTNLRTFRLRLDAAHSTQLSTIQAGIQLSQGINMWSGSNSSITSLAFDPVLGFPNETITNSLYGNLNFTTAQLNLSYQRYLSTKVPIQLSLKAMGQVATGPTPSTEQLGYGGSSFGRGLRSVTILGDQGVMASMELSYFNSNIIKGYLLQPYLFIDGGATSEISNGGPGNNAAATSGLGLKVFSSKSNWLSADVGWGFPFATNSNFIPGGTSNGFGYFKVTISF